MRKITTLKAALLLGAAVAAGTTASARTPLDFFCLEGADVAFPELPATTRMDMTDYFNSSMARPSTNAYDGEAIIDSADSATLTVRPATATTVQLSVLPGADTVLCVIETLALPQPDSRISFYTTDWAPLRKAPLDAPVLADWLTDEGRRQRAEVEAWLPFLIASATYDPETATLVITNEMQKYFAGDDDLQQLQEWLRPSLTYKWNGRRFDNVAQ